MISEISRKCPGISDYNDYGVITMIGTASKWLRPGDKAGERWEDDSVNVVRRRNE
jgi:hypothetical protein